MSLKDIAANVLNTVTGGVIDKALGMVDKLIPDKTRAAELKAQLETLRETNNHDLEMAEVALMAGQIEVNKAEATNPSLFVSGWRPAIGWICGVGIGFEFVVKPLILYGMTAAGVDLGKMPELDTSQLFSLVIAMLGLAGYRTYEKTQGVAAVNMKTPPAA